MRDYLNNNVFKKHILIISQYFYPETFRVNDIACELVNRGYQVTVLTGIPNYPMGKFFDGYDCKHRLKETWNGVNIIRIPLIARGNSRNKLLNTLGMISNYFSFVFSGYKWVRSKEAKVLDIDLVFTFEVSPMTQALIGVWYKKKFDVPTFLYIQDLWPENIELVTGIHNPMIIKPINKMVDYIYKNTDKLFTTSDSFRSAIINRKVPVPESKVYCWHQYAEDFYKPIDKDSAVENLKRFGLTSKGKELLDSNVIKIAFTGNLGTAQGLDILPKTALNLRALGITSKDVKFIIVGDGRYQNTLINTIIKYEIEEYFDFLGRQPAESIPYLLSLVDIGYLTYPDAQTIPAKLQSYMACGKCVLANAEFETRKIIEESKCGICSSFGDEKGLAKSITEIIKSKELLEYYGNNARRYFLSHFDKKMLMDEMEHFFEEIFRTGGKIE